MIARKEAQAAGAKVYETGLPCKQGHVAPRAVLTGTCTECTKQATLRWLAARPEKSAEYTAAYRGRNSVAVKVQDAKTRKARRAENPEKYRAISREWYCREQSAKGLTVSATSRLPDAEIAARVHQQHGDALQYVSGYQGMHVPAVFFCTIHNATLAARPHNAVRGANPCPQCNHMASKEEDRIFQLMSIYTPTLQRDRMLIKPKELDIYMPERQLAIEYCGMYWHSHFTAEDEKRDKKKHVAKYLACKEAGVRLLTIYESEWLEHEYALRRLLRNAAGKSRGKLMARKCELRKIETPEARVFYNKYHPQGGAGAGEHYALFWKGKIVACMRFVLGANDRGTGAAKRTWTLGRYATRITVAGAASRLFKAFLTDFNPTEVKSFSDNRYFDGGMYTQLGFALEADVAPDYQVWSPKIGVRPKSHYQRRVLPKRLLEHGIEDSFDPETDPRTEQDMTFLMGAGRIYDCGKKRWVWTATPKQ